MVVYGPASAAHQAQIAAPAQREVPWPYGASAAYRAAAAATEAAAADAPVGAASLAIEVFSQGWGQDERGFGTPMAFARAAWSDGSWAETPVGIENDVLRVAHELARDSAAWIFTEVAYEGQRLK